MIQKQKISNYDEIVEIEDLGMMQTYDFTIPKTHCFFSNGILIHNSLEQTCDKCILIYKTTQKDGEEKYFLNVAKNRQGKTDKQQIIFEGEYYRFRDFLLTDTEVNIAKTFDGRIL